MVRHFTSQPLDDDVVERLLAGLTAYPRYYAHMAGINSTGPAPVDLSPPEVADPVEIRRRIHGGEWVVDLRSRTAFARQHLAGTVNVEVGDSFATYLGWTMGWGTPVTLVGDTVDDARSATAARVPFIGIAAESHSRRGDLVKLFEQENAVAIIENINQIESAL